MNRIEICKKIIQSIKEYITTPSKIEAHRYENHFVRKRKLSMFQVLNYLLYSSKASMFINLAGIKEDLPALEFPNVTKQALSKARQFINPDLFKELFYLSVDTFYSSIPNRKDWHGYRLFAVDGSRIELPSSQSNYDFFGNLFTISDKSGHKKYYTQALASIIYDVLDDYIVHASLHHYLASERAAAQIHLDNLEALNIYDDSIVIFDRGYYSAKLFAHCVDKGHLCVMRLKENLKLSREALEKGDLITTITIGDKDDLRDITIRVVVVTLPDGSPEFLATNLYDKSITTELFKELYFKRWPVELKYKELKSRFRIEEFNGATPTAIFQEFYINLLMSNISSLIKNQADEEIQATCKPTCTYRYQANRSFVINRVKHSLCRIMIGSLSIEAIQKIYIEALNNKSQIQPNRSCYRTKDIRHRRRHFTNMKMSI